MAYPDGTIRNPVVEAQDDGSLLQDMAFIVGIPLAVVLVGVGITMVVYARADDSDALTAPSDDGASDVLEAEAVMVAELVESGDLTDES